MATGRTKVRFLSVAQMTVGSGIRTSGRRSVHLTTAGHDNAKLIGTRARQSECWNTCSTKNKFSEYFPFYVNREKLGNSKLVSCYDPFDESEIMSLELYVVPDYQLTSGNERDDTELLTTTKVIC